MYRLKIRQGDFANVWEFDTLQGVAKQIEFMFKAESVGELLQREKEFNARVYISYKSE